jgi:hypothetical protein
VISFRDIRIGNGVWASMQEDTKAAICCGIAGVIIGAAPIAAVIVYSWLFG